jgi:hypothetical protein
MYEFCLGIIKVVEVVKQIRVDEPKKQGFAKKCHKVVMDADCLLTVLCPLVRVSISRRITLSLI